MMQNEKRFQRRDDRPRRNDRPDVKPEFEQKLLDVARVARVVAGGKRFSFRATVAIGDRKGRVAIGMAKGLDVSKSVEKAVSKAKKQMIFVPMRKTTIPHEVYSKFCAAQILLKPAAQGKGLVAGGVVRILCDLAGIKDISAKILSRSTNKLNNAKATIEAFKKLKNIGGKNNIEKATEKNTENIIENKSE